MIEWNFNISCSMIIYTFYKMYNTVKNFNFIITMRRSRVRSWELSVWSLHVGVGFLLVPRFPPTFRNTLLVDCLL